jgi:hypothetical protein
MQKRPVGVTVLAVVAAVLAVLTILAAGIWWRDSGWILWLPRISRTARLIALILLVVGVSELAFAYGAWMLRPWAWTLGLVLQVVVLVLAVLQLGHFEYGRHIITIVLAAVTLWYLSTPRVRTAFGRS